MKTIWDPACRQQILARFEKLTPDARPAWGQMTAAQMLAHLADPLKAAMGSKTVAAKPSAFSNPIVRTLIIYACRGQRARLRLPSSYTLTRSISEII